MANNILSAAKFKSLQPSENDRLVSDGNNLYVSMRSIDNGGAKSFRMTYRMNRKKKWITLKATGLAEARKERDTYTAWVKQGKDPSLERDLEKERQRQQQIAEQNDLARLQARMTVRTLFDRWHDLKIFKRKDCKEIVRTFENNIFPLIGDMFVEDVHKGHITQITDAMLARGVNKMANNTFALMRQMFRFAVTRDFIEFDPTTSLSKAEIGGKDTERDRVLSDEEISSLALLIANSGLIYSTQYAIWIALATMCRIGELSQAKHSDIDWELKTWSIPEDTSKNTKAHTIYLSDFALKQFKSLASLSASETWLFPNRNNTNHVCLKSITKQVHGRQTLKVYKGRSKNNQELVLAGGKWTPHDLRRSGATLMTKLGVAPDVVEKCLNHTEENKVKRIYQRYNYKDEQKAAWKLLGENLDLIRDKALINKPKDQLDS